MRASSKIDSIVKSMRGLTDYQRNIKLADVAEQYGKGFANVIRRELESRLKAGSK